MAQARRGEISHTSKRRTGRVKIDGQWYVVRQLKTRVEQRLIALYERLDGVENGDRLNASSEDVDEIIELTVAIFANNDGTKTRPSSRDRIRKRLDDEDDELDLDDLQTVTRRVAEKWAQETGRPTSSASTS